MEERDPTGYRRQKKGIPLVFKIMGAGLLILLCGVLAAAIYYVNCEECQEVVQGLAAGYAKINDAQYGPVADALREQGCDQAFVMLPDTLEDFVGAIDRMVEGENLQEDMRRELQDYVVLACTQGGFSAPTGPECADLAALYGEIEGGDAMSRVAVVVQGGTPAREYCRGVFSPSGEMLEEFPP